MTDWLLVALLGAAPAGPATVNRTTVPGVVRVYVNTADVGDFFVEFGDSSDVLLPARDFSKMGLRLRPSAQDSSEMVSLKSLEPQLHFDMDTSAAALRLSASVDILPAHRVELVRRERAIVEELASPSGFLNYKISFRSADPNQRDAWSMPLEAVTRTRAWLGMSHFLLGSDGPAVRLNSSLAWGAPHRPMRIVLGDSPGRSGRMGGSLFLGGVHVASDFRSEWLDDLGPHPTLEGVLETPSDVEIYSNGTLIRQEHLSAGSFRYSGLPLGAGSGTLSLRIRDSFGRERVVDVPYYQSSSLLRPGLSEYSYSFGFARRGFGLQSFDYGNVALLGTHRVGITRFLTAGLGVEADPNTVHIGPSAVWTVGALCEVQAGIAGSREGGVTGGRGLLGLARRGKQYSVGASVERYSQEYKGVSRGFGPVRARQAATLTGAVRQRTWGSLSGQFDRADYYAREALRRLSLTYNRSLFRSISLMLRAQWTRQGRTQANQAFALMTMGLGFLRTGTLDLRHLNGSDHLRVDVRQEVSRGTGFAYEARWETIDRGTSQAATGGLLSARYQRTHFLTTCQYQGRSGTQEWRMSLAGSIAAVDGSLHLARPIGDGFALVRVGTAEGVPVLLWNQRNGVTGRRGELFVPDLNSRGTNRIALDQRALPINWSLERPERSVRLPYRGGGVVDFHPVRLQSFEGHAYFVRGGVAVPAELAGMEIQIEGRTVQSVVGKRGEFYFENLPPGQFAARMFLDGRECGFTLTVPRSEDMIVDLGEIRCESSP